MDIEASNDVKVCATRERETTAFDERTESLFLERYREMNARYDRLLMKLMLVQWAAAILLALWLSPRAWVGKQSGLHAHVFAAIFLGAAICSLPVLLALRSPGQQNTRYAIATGQMFWSALLIHLTGGRIETHFHVFASLAILSFYRDVKVLVPATITVAADHFIRGMYWPESVFGVTNPEWWRFLEHAGWVIFLDVFLVYNCLNLKRELMRICQQQVELEDAKETTARYEKLAAVGQLAAGVGHELRNPLAAVRNAAAYIDKKLSSAGQVDPKIKRFMQIIDRELEASNKIISNLLDFSRPKEPTRSPCPLRPLVQEVMTIVPPRSGVTLVNEVPDDLPVPDLDKDQFRQVMMNLIQNGSEAVPDGKEGRVVVRAEGGHHMPWRITVSDDGAGIPDAVRKKIFEPLFSTKVKGTGLGLAVVLGIIERHGASLEVETRPGEGSQFIIRVPPISTKLAA